MLSPLATFKWYLLNADFQDYQDLRDLFVSNAHTPTICVYPDNPGNLRSISPPNAKIILGSMLSPLAT